MKKLFIILSVFAGIITEISAQNASPVIMTTWQFEKPHLQKDDTCFDNFNIEEFLNWYVDKGIRPNPHIKNFRMLSHGWGEDSRKTIFLYEIDNISNIDKVGERTDSLLNASFKTETEKKLFWRRMNILFDRHSDNILYDAVKPKN